MVKSVLFVDDEPLVARLYARAAMSLGLETRFAQDGEAALEAVAQAPPSLIISDLNMPGMTGLEMADALLQTRRKTMPVILLTADDGAAVIRAGLAHGVDDFLMKGVRFELVIARMRFWTEGPLAGLPHDARVHARKTLAGYQPSQDPLMLLQIPRWLLIERAAVSVLDQLLAAPPGFGAKAAERERLLGLISGVLLLLSRTDPLALLRQADHIMAVLAHLGEQWSARVAAELAAIDAISERATYQHAAQSLMLQP